MFEIYEFTKAMQVSNWTKWTTLPLVVYKHAINFLLCPKWFPSQTCRIFMCDRDHKFALMIMIMIMGHARRKTNWAYCKPYRHQLKHMQIL